MADKFMQTTSSRTLDEFNDNSVLSAAITPKIADTNAMTTGNLTKMAMNLNESYQLVKARQQKYNELSLRSQNANNKRVKLLTEAAENKENANELSAEHGGEWQQVCNAKNKLKRKKKMSASLTSVTDTVNQEKRTRIEGIQLNCRGKLQIKEGQAGVQVVATNSNAKATACTNEKIMAKPPLPPSTPKANTAGGNTILTPPPRLKRKLQENVQTIQKLNALTEQLRLEINELKTSLTSERGTVRVLRAQNECEARKWKNEVKKLQHMVELLKKSSASTTNLKKISDSPHAASSESSSTTAASSLVNYEIQRLTNEINLMKEANKALEEKKLINCDADRRKAADLRTLKESYEIRLTQLTKSAKIEISRLLEEIKTKERNIGQLKKDLQILQNQNANSTITTSAAAAAATKAKHADVNKNKNKNTKTTTDKLTNKLNVNTITTTTKSTNKKPKNTKINELQNTNARHARTEHADNEAKKSNQIVDKQQMNAATAAATTPTKPTAATAVTVTAQDINLAQHTNEITQLKDIELIKNSKNLHLKTTRATTNNVNTTKATTMPTITTNKTLTQTQNNILQSLDGNGEQKSMLNNEHFNSLLTTATTTTTNNETNTTCACQREYHSLPHELTARLMSDANDKMDSGSGSGAETEPSNKNECNDLPIYRTKDSHSDSDSALSSAPPSISPQPPPAGMDTNDIWQTIRTYTQDIEKLQKELEFLHKENEHLHTELNLAKEQILDYEKTAIEANKQNKIPQYIERIKHLEEQEHQLHAECNELREQNELLEFRILELEETNDKWSLQGHATTPSNANTNTTQDVWSHSKAQNEAMQLIFTNNNNNNNNNINTNSNNNNAHNNKNNYGHIDSGITSPQSQHNIEDDINLMDASNEELCRHIGSIIKKTTSLDEEDKQFLQHVLTLLQQMDLYSQRTSSGPASLNTSCSSDEPSSLELAKSRVSDYSSASSTTSSARQHTSGNSEANVKPLKATAQNSRIVATVQPYSSCNTTHTSSTAVSASLPHPPTNTPNDSPRKTQRAAWQCNSLSESGVFVEDTDAEFADATNASANSNNNYNHSDHSVCTQTDFFEFEDPRQKLQRYHSSPLTTRSAQQNCSHTSDLKRLQYYKDRLELLESKVLIYESSGDIQTKRLADRLQREIQLEKDLKELQARVELLEQENLTLEEEKCEFEEAENDTRLRLQRLEIDLEILSQRNVELEMSKEALSAKYKDCRSECLILRDDLAACETQIRLIEEDKQKAKDNFEFLHSTIPLFCLYSALQIASSQQQQQQQQQQNGTAMGNNMPTHPSMRTQQHCQQHCQQQQQQHNNANKPYAMQIHEHTNDSHQVNSLKEEIKCLRHQIKELNSRHYAALESADSHWVDLERDYKEREEVYRAKEQCLKQKINKLQDCLREDARAANEKIQQLEESEAGLKVCLVRVSKEHRDILEQYKAMCEDFDRLKEENQMFKEHSKPLAEAYEAEKKRCKCLQDEVAFMHRLQQESETRNKNEEDSLRASFHDLKKQFLHSEVTNSELKEEVTTLEHQIEALQKQIKEYEDRLRVLQDEIRTKEEMCDRLERQVIEKGDGGGYSLAQELKDGMSSKCPKSTKFEPSESPSKRAKCTQAVEDLRTAAAGLNCALRNFEVTEDNLKKHKQFHNVAMDVKQLADNLLGGDEQQETEEPKTEVSTDSMNYETAVSEGEKHEKLAERDVDSQAGTHTSETKQNSERGSQSDDNEGENMNVTIGMALVPKFCISAPMLRNTGKSYYEPPKTTYKQPINANPAQAPPSDWALSKKYLNKTAVQRPSAFTHSLPGHVRGIFSYNDGGIGGHDVSDHNMTRTSSQESFHSAFEELPHSSTTYAHTYTDHSTEMTPRAPIITPVVPVTSEKATEVAKETIEISVQVDEEENSQLLLNSLPNPIYDFISQLKAAVPHELMKTKRFHTNLMKRWDYDEEFRQGMDVLRLWANVNDTNSKLLAIENYEHFVMVTKTLGVLEQFFKPHKIGFLQKIQTKVDEHLMQFYSRKIESEFYCNVYYPVQRQRALHSEP